MTERLIGLWAHLRTLPVFWLALTLGVFHLASLLARRTHGFPLANPVGLSILILALLLYFTGTPYASYFAGGQWIHFLLTPATVALAVPLYQQKERIRSLLTPLLLTLACGSLLAVVASVGIGWALGASPPTLMSLAPKSVTTPIAMGIAEQIGGLASLTAVFVILTGIVGSIGFPLLFRVLKIRDHAVQGFAVGLAAHGMGTARAFLFSEEMGAFSALAMGLNGLLTAVLLPLIFH